MSTSHRKYTLVAAVTVVVSLSAIAAFLLAVPMVYGDQQALLSKQPTQDTYVASGRPNESWPALRTMWIGHDQTSEHGKERILFQFDLREIPTDSQIQSAKLRLYLAATTPGDAPMNVVARRISNSWAENVTWNQYLSLSVVASPTAATQVGKQFSWYEWNLQDILQDWSNDRPPNDGKFSLVLIGNETSGQHERVFWSKDCSDADCGVQPGRRPRLEVNFTEPMPTATPTPTAGLKSLVLRNVPATALEPGDEVTYIIQYTNGWLPLTDFTITNAIPSGVSLVPGSISSGGTVNGGSVRWTIGNLSRDGTGSVSYKARRPTSTPTTTATSTRTPTATRTASVTPTSTLTRTPTPTGTPSTGRLQGVAFSDTNVNLLLDADEELLGSALLALKQGNSVVSTAISNVNGVFVFSDLAPGVYSILEQASPAGYDVSISRMTVRVEANTVWSVYIPHTPLPARGGETVVRHGVNNAVSQPEPAIETATAHQPLLDTVTPAYTPTATPTVTPSTGTVGGRTFEDRNGDDFPNNGEPFLPNASISLWQDPWLFSTNSNSDGVFMFTGVPPGQYALFEQSPPSGYHLSESNLTFDISANTSLEFFISHDSASVAEINGTTLVGTSALGTESTTPTPESSLDMIAQESIHNSGATATWRYNGQPGQLTSNNTWNPSGVLWLPVIRRG